MVEFIFVPLGYLAGAAVASSAFMSLILGGIALYQKKKIDRLTEQGLLDEAAIAEQQKQNQLLAANLYALNNAVYIEKKHGHFILQRLRDNKYYTYAETFIATDLEDTAIVTWHDFSAALSYAREELKVQAYLR